MVTMQRRGFARRPKRGLETTINKPCHSWAFPITTFTIPKHAEAKFARPA
jgi:hypothetical protein